MSRRHLKGWLISSGEMPFCGWRDATLSPASPESQFCVVRGQDNKAVPMLERVAGDLVSSTEALALEEKPVVERKVQRPVLRHLDEHSQTRLKEHTVFVINALHFTDFLHAFDIDAASTRNLQ